MSQPVQHQPKQPIVRLQTWVNVVLVLILFASCSANRDTVNVPDENTIATEVVNQLQTQNGLGNPAGPASSAEVEDLCRLLGALAAKQGVPLTVMNAHEQTRCHAAAQEAVAKP